MFVTINYVRCSISFSQKPSAEVLHGLRIEGFRWHPVNKTWTRAAGWNDLPDDFCDWLVSQADPAPVEPTAEETANAASTAAAAF